MEGDIVIGKSSFLRYKQRSIQDITYLEWLREWNWKLQRRRPRAQPRILNYNPRYKGDPRNPQFEDFCRVKMMLNHSFKEVKDLLTINGATYATYKKAYIICSLIHTYGNDAYGDVIELGDNNEFKPVDNNEF